MKALAIAALLLAPTPGAAAPAAHDPIRPALPFTPRANRIADPDGLVFYAFPDRHVAKVPLPAGRVRFRLIVDRSIAELFADGGQATIPSIKVRSAT